MFCGLECICSFFFFFSSICRAFFLSFCPSPSLSARPSALLHESTYLSACSPAHASSHLFIYASSVRSLSIIWLSVFMFLYFKLLHHLSMPLLSSVFLCIMTLGFIFAIAVLIFLMCIL